MLIVEGSDRVGKTTLCQKLVKYLGNSGPWMYRHFGPLPPGWTHPWDYFPAMSRHVVQDRFHLSEWAYRTAEGDTKLTFSSEMYRLVDARLRLLGSVTVVITADAKIIRQRSGNSTAITANILFMNVPKYYDVDFCYHGEKVSDDDAFIEKVLKLYRERQELTKHASV